MKRSRLRPKSLSDHAALKRECTKLMRILVLHRDRWKCRACGKGEEVVLQAAHIKRKGTYRSLEFVLENVVTLCKSCHWRQHGMTDEKQREFFVAIIGEENMALLEQQARLIRKTDLKTLKVWLSHLANAEDVEQMPRSVRERMPWLVN